MSDGTYPQPKDGWVCFHCGERFTTWGSARDHFGATPELEPGCLIGVHPGKDRRLLSALRKSESLSVDQGSQLSGLRKMLDICHDMMEQRDAAQGG